MPFYPGPGLGGHCIPVDPYYLTWKARLNGLEPRLIELAAQINSQMPLFTIGRVAEILNEKQKSLKGSKILALGVAYKRDTGDTRESAAIEVLRGLHERGAIVHYADPYVLSLDLNGTLLKSVNLNPGLLRSMDCVLVLADHSIFDYPMVAAQSSLVLDTRNALKDFPAPNVMRL
jgi:UDP-N-acetyl-D-glucosamine dehydrogenase